MSFLEQPHHLPTYFLTVQRSVTASLEVFCYLERSSWLQSIAALARAIKATQEQAKLGIFSLISHGTWRASLYPPSDIASPAGGLACHLTTSGSPKQWPMGNFPNKVEVRDSSYRFQLKCCIRNVEFFYFKDRDGGCSHYSINHLCHACITEAITAEMDMGPPHTWLVAIPVSL